MKIDIRKFRYSLKAFIAFEQAVGHTFGEGTPLSDMVTLFYCFYITTPDAEEMTFDDFIQELDKEEDKIREFSAWLERKGRIQEELEDKKKEAGES